MPNRSSSTIPTAIALAVVMLATSVAMLPLYFGSAAAFLAFSSAAVALAVTGIALSRSVFCRLLAFFLCLGFWAKLLAHLMGSDLIEPVGDFPSSGAAWDRALWVSAAALASTALAIALCGAFDRLYATTTTDLPKLSASFAVALFIFSAMVALALFVINRRYTILTIGFIPRIELHSYVYVTISFIVSWGAMLWLGALAFWLVRLGRWPIDAIFYLAAIEGAIASISMGSRAQMILHVIAVAATYALWRQRCGWRISLRRWLAIGAITALAFVGSLATVTLDRLLAFSDPVPAFTTDEVRAPVVDATPQQRIPPSPALDKEPSSERNDISVLILKFSSVYRELTQLVVMRWIGLEGVMAITSADGLGVPLFKELLIERPEVGNNAIYQRLSKSEYGHFRDFVFLTLPGPTALLASAASIPILAIGMMFVVAIGYLMERYAGACTGNPIVSGVTGCALAFLVMNMNFPRTLFFFTLTLAMAISVIGLFRLVVAHWFRGNADR